VRDRRAARETTARSTRRPRPSRRYFVPLPLVPVDDPVELGADVLESVELGLVVVVVVVVELLSVEVEPDGAGVVTDGEVVDGAVLGEADGVVRSTGRSPTRSVRVSLHAVSRPRLSATAKTAVSILFISLPLLVGLRDRYANVQRLCRYPRLDRPQDNHYQCGSDLRGRKGDAR